MRHLLLSYSLIFFCIISATSQITKKVLFIGNSYTASNNLPSLVNNMAMSTGDVLIYDSNTPGGFRFINHASNTTTLNKINSDNWDYVTLQAQSQETSLSPSQMATELYPYAASLSNTIRANDVCSQPLFYMTWGRENGDAGNCAIRPWVCTYEGMDDAIKATYSLMADTNEAEVAPAGAVWRFIRTNHPSIDLYSSDGSHPSLAGSYAAACAFYTMIYKKDPTTITWNSSLSETLANTIKMAAKTIVFDTITNWDFTINQAMADYSEVITTDVVSFTNTSADFDSILWDFGDGTASTEINPVHTFLAIGNYSVSLTNTKCGKSNTKTKNISITNLSVAEFDIEGVSLFPNPAYNTLNIKLNKNYADLNILIFDISGKIVLEKTVQDVARLDLNVKSLSNGMYIIKMSADKDFYIKKILKSN
ncbi:T9SS type A sorting domain-containing protein [Lacinutrix jangbogonensis]|uniref:T9SS type A sorting domain-containing protein n=1 Tax=Lacinutrix jangbogonensis TaxID=1469557 RepID=UPI00068EA3EC|nr:T9SS type A sorting domain-containing protein [Lacinutrix jangbogonensis]